jgi:mono/diheme cytochrome c family protein
MPVWGDIFAQLDRSDRRVTMRIENIVEYIRTLQAPSSNPDDVGAKLFATYCASCHGKNGRGDGPVSAELRRTPPDLTRFTAWNGGAFPRDRVYRIIDGREVRAHGDRTMPVWGDAFSRSREAPSDADVRQRLDAIVRYLEAIQQRGA